MRAWSPRRSAWAEGHASTQEIATAIQSLLVTLARSRGLPLFVDDVHWAEPALPALLAGLPAQDEDAPLLVLCLARPELLDGEAQREATVTLQPLADDAATALVEQLLGEAALPGSLAERISGAAGGNPLFVVELVGMLVDDGMLERRNGSWTAGPGSRSSRSRPRCVRGMAFAVSHPLCRGEIDLLAGDENAAERELRRSLDPLVAMFDFPSAANAASLLADVLVERDELEEAAEFVGRAAEWPPNDQPIQHARVRAARARLLARQQHPDAEALAREAVGLADTTDFLDLRETASWRSPTSCAGPAGTRVRPRRSGRRFASASGGATPSRPTGFARCWLRSARRPSGGCDRRLVAGR